VKIKIINFGGKPAKIIFLILAAKRNVVKMILISVAKKPLEITLFSAVAAENRPYIW
jgi:hypothetical protein